MDANCYMFMVGALALGLVVGLFVNKRFIPGG